MQCCPSLVNTTLHRLFLHKRCLLATGQHWTGKSLCSVIEEAPDKVGQEKILINVALILLGQHSAGKTSLLNNIIFRQFSFWTGYFLDNNWLLQMPLQHCTTFPEICNFVNLLQILRQHWTKRQDCKEQ